MDSATRVLLIEDNPGDVRLIELMLKEARGIELRCAQTLGDALGLTSAGTGRGFSGWRNGIGRIGLCCQGFSARLWNPTALRVWRIRGMNEEE